jgi:hypothetical protein
VLFRKSNKAKAEKKQAAAATPSAAPAAPAANAKKAKKAKPKPPAGLYSKPRADLFTVLLVLSWLAVIVGIVFLWLEMSEYQYNFNKGAPSVGMIDAPAATLVCSSGVAFPRSSDS